MEYLSLIIGAIVVIVLFAMQNRQLAKLSDELNRKTEANNKDTQKKIDEVFYHINDKIDRNNENVQHSIAEQLNSSRKQMTESQKVISDISARIAAINKTNEQVVNVADELKTLQAVLQNPKQRGVFGEYYLDTVLGNILPPGTYQTQYKFKDGEIVDAVVFLDKGKILPIDSKFSLENYNRMVAATNKSERDLYAKKVSADLKGRIDETSKYIRPTEKTMDFAFMFIPSESLYYDMLINKVGVASTERDLIEYAYRDKHVIVTSPTSFMAYLQTILQGLRSLEIEKDAQEIQARVAKLGQHIDAFDANMTKLGNALGTTVNHYNTAYKNLAQIDKDVVKITTGKNENLNINTKTLEKPQLGE
ncbi:MAG: DNA recombination protein RmuC [Candidatus Nanosyncoccaceae bacterium]